MNVTPDLMESALGGFGALPMSDWLHHWLEPVVSEAHLIQVEYIGEMGHYSPIGGGEVAWALLSTVGAMLLVAITLRLVSAVDHSTKPLGSKENKVSQFLYNKWYIDELYDEWIVKPLWSMANFCWKKFDQGFIDKSVNLSGRGARGIGWFGSLFHTGQVNTYAFFLTLGLLLVLLMVVS